MIDWGAVAVACLAPACAVVVVVRGACERVRERRKRREIQLADDYDEVLRLIEWKPTELTEVQRLQEELEV